MRVRAQIEERKGERNKLFITSVPYGITVDRLAESIEKAIKTKKLPIRHIDNLTSKNVEMELSLTPAPTPQRCAKPSTLSPSANGVFPVASLCSARTAPAR